MIDGFSCKEMVQRPGAIELIIGLVEGSRSAGRHVRHGGTAVEVLNDTTLELPPSTWRWPGHRSRQPRVAAASSYRGHFRDLDAIARTLIPIASFGVMRRRELDINPLLADRKA